MEDMSGPAVTSLFRSAIKRRNEFLISRARSYIRVTHARTPETRKYSGRRLRALITIGAIRRVLSPNDARFVTPARGFARFVMGNYVGIMRPRADLLSIPR